MTKISRMQIWIKRKKHKLFWRVSKKYREKKYAEAIMLLKKKGAVYNKKHYWFDFKRDGFWIRDSMVHKWIEQDCLPEMIWLLIRQARRALWDGAFFDEQMNRRIENDE